jgi:hypothetical protein
MGGFRCFASTTFRLNEATSLLGALLLAHYEGNLGPAPHSQFPHDVTYVMPHGENRNTQPLGYFAVGQALGNQVC